jgi:DNA-binding response OmpR family regulator
MMNILYIDDMPLLTKFYGQALTKAGYEITTAKSGEECLEILQTQKPDLILLDIMMKPMDGWQVLSRIRKNDPDHNIPVIMLTAKSIFPGEVFMYGEFFDGYIMKPLTIDALNKEISDYFLLRETIRRETAGANPATIDEYTLLRVRVNVWERIITRLEQMLANAEEMSISNEEIFKQLDAIKDRLRTYQTRCGELAATLKKAA